MRVFLQAGLLYLLGVSIVLAVKPNLMFREDGSWKEFGIGRNPKQQTIFPFWMFSILWAILSYILTVQVFAILGGYKAAPANSAAPKLNIQDTVLDVETDEIVPTPRRGRRRGASSLPKGQQLLNRTATEEAGGIPKYVQLGEDLTE